MHQGPVHALFPTPVGSYSGFGGQDPFREHLLELLQTQQGLNNGPDPRIRPRFDGACQRGGVAGAIAKGTPGLDTELRENL